MGNINISRGFGLGYSGFSGWSGMPGAFTASGFSGYSGQSGFSGFSGQIGSQGISGFSGLSGWSGISGQSGRSGYSGISGWSGSVGSQGLSGFSGRSGYSGISGASGQSGFSGFSGWSGGVGPAGSQGISGFSGISGWSGMQGASGLSGWSGISGWSGWSGAQGAPGTGDVSSNVANTFTASPQTIHGSGLTELDIRSDTDKSQINLTYNTSGTVMSVGCDVTGGYVAMQTTSPFRIDALGVDTSFGSGGVSSLGYSASDGTQYYTNVTAGGITPFNSSDGSYSSLGSSGLTVTNGSLTSAVTPTEVDTNTVNAGNVLVGAGGVSVTDGANTSTYNPSGCTVAGSVGCHSLSWSYGDLGISNSGLTTVGPVQCSSLTISDGYGGYSQLYSSYLMLPTATSSGSVGNNALFLNSIDSHLHWVDGGGVDHDLLAASQITDYGASGSTSASVSLIYTSGQNDKILVITLGGVQYYVPAWSSV